MLQSITMTPGAHRLNIATETLLNGPPMSIVEVKESGIPWLSVKIPQQP